MPKAPAKPAPVPEHVLKKRKAQEAIAAAKVAKLAEDKKASKVERKAIYDKAAKYLKEYKAMESDVVDKRREAKKTGNFYMEPEPKVMLVVRIKGINAVAPKTRKILQLMRLRQVHAARAPAMCKRTDPFCDPALLPALKAGWEGRDFMGALCARVGVLQMSRTAGASNSFS